MSKHGSKDSKITEKSEKEQFGSLEVSTAFLAQLFGKTDRTITSWAKDRGMPKIKHGRFDLRMVLDWWLENIFESAAEASDETIQEAKRRYWSAKAGREELRVSRERETLVPIEEISAAWGSRAVELAAALNFLENRLATRGAMKPQGELRSIVRSETRQMRATYCREGKFCAWVEGEQSTAG